MNVSTEVGHGVVIARDRDGRARVVIAVEPEGDDFDDTVVLSKAWANLAQAITAHQHKTAQVGSEEPPPGAEDAGAETATPPGTGAWWNG